jgi:hypothetical protein
MVVLKEWIILSNFTFSEPCIMLPIREQDQEDEQFFLIYFN